MTNTMKVDLKLKTENLEKEEVATEEEATEVVTEVAAVVINRDLKEISSIDQNTLKVVRFKTKVKKVLSMDIIRKDTLDMVTKNISSMENQGKIGTHLTDMTVLEEAENTKRKDTVKVTGEQNLNSFTRRKETLIQNSLLKKGKKRKK